LAEFCGVKHAVTVASGTDALFIPMLAMEIGRGHAVFVPAFTYTATAEVILLAGAEPVFVDVDPGTFNIDPADLERKIEATQLAGKLTPKAILAVDLFGLPADWSALNGIAGKHELTLISDAAQSFGGMHDNKRVGALAPVTGTSFFPAKPLGCYGDGGAIFTDDAGLAEVMRSIRTHGTGSHKYDVVRVGLNGRLDTLQAAILSVKLSVFAEELDVRERISRVYDDGLRDVVEVPERVPGARSAWAQYTIKTRRRQELQDKLKADGIPTMIYYPKPMHFQAPYAPFGEGPGSIPVSEGLCGQVLSLPMHPYLRDADVMRIVGSIREALGRQG
jgi:dTDP-4-amino-4,6-dideoxygalactose transaminase